jgi:hypothetical protein
LELEPPVIATKLQTHVAPSCQHPVNDEEGLPPIAEKVELLGPCFTQTFSRDLAGHGHGFPVAVAAAGLAVLELGMLRQLWLLWPLRPPA